jgi:biotin--protein ligase
MSQALVYLDEGVCRQSAHALVEQLEDILDPSISVLKVDSAYLKTESWEDKTVVVVMGGGVCSTWDKQLGFEGIEKIGQYVFKGGRYMGLCAGAYFACAESRFELDDQKPIEKTRPLAFFSGKAIGPLILTDDYLSMTAARAAEVSYKIRGFSQIGSLYYQGGCFFDLKEDTADVQIMSYYHRLGKASALFCKVGRGFALLDGTHPEFKWSASLSAGADCFYAELVQELSSQEDFRRKVWEEIREKLTLPLRI